MVTIEKWHRYSDPTAASLSEDARIIGQCAALKRLNPNVSCVFYTNAAIDFEWYDIHQGMLTHPSWGLATDNGTKVAITGRTVFNMANQSCAGRFLEMCTAALGSGAVDGCFVDRSDPVWPYHVRTPRPA
eukprot:TRINITY_DN33224_c0_g1_i1.p2 TRINITY_DN33224_c0_g1~~TRINITY_DN33224_c0_g1_i1.p2  ORF type:complete len:130 (+),score=22.14 TRINITY_DN33224_c0_g1_i1:1-390(+)